MSGSPLCACILGDCWALHSNVLCSPLPSTELVKSALHFSGLATGCKRANDQLLCREMLLATAGEIKRSRNLPGRHSPDLRRRIVRADQHVARVERSENPGSRAG